MSLENALLKLTDRTVKVYNRNGYLTIAGYRLYTRLIDSLKEIREERGLTLTKQALEKVIKELDKKVKVVE